MAAKNTVFFRAYLYLKSVDHLVYWLQFEAKFGPFKFVLHQNFLEVPSLIFSLQGMIWGDGLTTTHDQ